MEVKRCIESRDAAHKLMVKSRRELKGAQNLNSNDQMRVTLDINIHSRTW